MLDRLEAAPAHSFEEHSIIHTLEQKAELADSPLHRIEHGLQPWISFLVMPLFALANAGVDLTENVGGALRHPVSFGIVLGLFAGKPIGIWLFAFLAVRTGIATAPANATGRQVFGASWLRGIGFTMSLFVAGLAFEDASLLDIAKIAILGASVLSGICGVIVLAASGPTPIETADSA